MIGGSKVRRMLLLKRRRNCKGAFLLGACHSWRRHLGFCGYISEKLNQNGAYNKKLPHAANLTDEIARKNKIKKHDK
jgi:hypothetical protein